MKKFFKYSGLIALALAVVAFVLVLVCHPIVGTNAPADNWYSASAVLFGKGPAEYTIYITFKGTFEGKASGAALVAWIFGLVSMLGLLLGALLPALKVKVPGKVLGLLNLCSVLLLLTAGILLFFTVPSFAGANEWNNSNGWGLSFGYVLAAIFYIVAGGIAVCPTVVDFISKK